MMNETFSVIFKHRDFLKLNSSYFYYIGGNLVVITRAFFFLEATDQKIVVVCDKN